MLSTLFIIAVAVAIYSYSRYASHKREVRRSLKYIDDISPRLRISVVVSGIKGVGYISSLLRSPSTSYQVVVVGDFAANLALLREITQHFGLFAANFTYSDQLTAGAVRSLYRSHKRLYSRVIIVDSPSSKLYTPFEVGATVSDYNYCLLLHTSRTLLTEAIHDLLFELSSRPEGEVEKITSHRGERFALLLREAALPMGKEHITINKKRRIKIGYPLLQGFR